MAHVRVRLSSTGTKKNGKRTGYFKTTTKNSRDKRKIEKMGFDPVLQKHVLFKEEKLK